MDKEQQRLARRLAGNIQGHLNAMKRRMDVIQGMNLDTIEASFVVDIFDQLPRYWRDIERVIADMLKELEDK